jgi:hypothetical protein
MLKVNVGMSRKVSRDFNSTGFSVNLEGEICASLDDLEAVVERIKEFYDLAEESLAQQIERYEGESAIASREEQIVPASAPNETASPEREHKGNGQHSEPRSNRQRPNGNGHSQANQSQKPRTSNGDTFVPATNKQIQFLLTLGKRDGMNKPQLENRIAGIIGRTSDLYELSKQEAGMILDSLTEGTKANSSRR